jgi:tetratricopeptide (TPR) repeat protein
MPLELPYAACHASFYRPALELCGYRTCRAWSGLSSDAHADVVLALIGKAGLVFADVSELTPGVAYQIGAAHALGKLGALVVRADRAATVPGTIGHDAVLHYDPTEDDWPTGAVLLMAACLASLRLAADRGERLRIKPDSIARAFDAVSQALQHVLLPREAVDVQRRARRALDAGDFATAEAGFDAACKLGLCDDETRLWRGWTRLGLGKLADAAADLDAVVGGDPSAPTGEWRPIAAYMRGILREVQEDLRGALADYDLAIALGLPDADARARRDALAARLATS